MMSARVELLGVTLVRRQRDFADVARLGDALVVSPRVVERWRLHDPDARVVVWFAPERPQWRVARNHLLTGWPDELLHVIVEVSTCPPTLPAVQHHCSCKQINKTQCWNTWLARDVIVRFALFTSGALKVALKNLLLHETVDFDEMGFRMSALKWMKHTLKWNINLKMHMKRLFAKNDILNFAKNILILSTTFQPNCLGLI